MLPYGDHTYAIVGAKQDWFKEVGIDFQYQSIKVEEIVPYLKNGTMDVVSSPPGILISAHDNAPNLCSFVFGDLFQGYAILAQPNGGYKSYDEFVKEGMSSPAAAGPPRNSLKAKPLLSPRRRPLNPSSIWYLRKVALSGVTSSRLSLTTL